MIEISSNENATAQYSALIVAELKTTEVLSYFHLHNHFVPE